MTDLMRELNEEIARINAFAFDQGCAITFEKIIQLSEISGGRLTTKQLKDFQEYLEGKVQEQNERKAREAQTQQQEADEALQPRFELLDTQVVELPWERASEQQDVPGQGEASQAKQAGEEISQAESSEGQ